VIKQSAFTVEPWALRETALDVGMLAQTESVFALSNGHIGWRANLDEGEPHGLPGSYLNGLYELRPLPYAEVSYGLPESGQSVINITNGKLIRLFVDDEPFDVRYGKLRSHERLLDFRTGTLTRNAEWVSPAGGAVRVRSTRLVSFTHRAIAAMRYEVEPVDGRLQITVQSELLANEQLPSSDGDPRAGFTPDHPLTGEYDGARENAVVLVHRTKVSGLRVAAAMDHLIDAPAPMRTESQAFEDGGKAVLEGAEDVIAFPFEMAADAVEGVTNLVEGGYQMLSNGVHAVVSGAASAAHAVAIDLPVAVASDVASITTTAMDDAASLAGAAATVAGGVKMIGALL